MEVEDLRRLFAFPVRGPRLLTLGSFFMVYLGAGLCGSDAPYVVSPWINR